MTPWPTVLAPSARSITGPRARYGSLTGRECAGASIDPDDAAVMAHGEIPLDSRWDVEDASRPAAGAVHLFCLPESDYVTGEVLVAAGGPRAGLPAAGAPGPSRRPPPP